MKLFCLLKKHGALLIFIAFYILITFLTYKDYGITADEENRYNAGKIFANKLLGKENDVNIEERHLPENSTYFLWHTAFYAFLNPSGYYEWYHLINMVMALPTFIAIYYLIFKTYNSSIKGIVGVLFLFFLPRFIGHIPTNPKDIPFSTFYLLSITSIYIHSKATNIRANIIWLILAVFLISITAGMRIIGLGLIPVLILNNFIKNRNLRESACLSVTIITLVLFFMFLLMPILHSNPIMGFYNLIDSSKDFSQWNNHFYFEGNFLTKYERPWYYLFTWLWITTPLYLIFTNLLAIKNLKPILKRDVYRLSALSILLNISLYLILNPVIYNGLRHFLFLLPLFAITAVISFFDFLHEKKSLFANFIKLLVVTNFFYIGIFLFKMHPYQYVFFNSLSGGLKNAVNYYDSEYWGASYKEGSEIIIKLEENNEKISRVYPCNVSYAVQYYSKGKFIVTGSQAEADYVLCDMARYRLERIKGDIIYSVSRMDVPLLYIIKPPGKI